MMYERMKSERGTWGCSLVSEALQKNTVRQNQSLHFFHFHLSLFIQTLTELYLDNNQIGDKGAQYLQKLKKTNTNLNISW